MDAATERRRRGARSLVAGCGPSNRLCPRSGRGWMHFDTCYHLEHACSTSKVCVHCEADSPAGCHAVGRGSLPCPVRRWRDAGGGRRHAADAHSRDSPCFLGTDASHSTRCVCLVPVLMVPLWCTPPLRGAAVVREAVVAGCWPRTDSARVPAAAGCISIHAVILSMHAAHARCASTARRIVRLDATLRAETPCPAPYAAGEQRAAGGGTQQMRTLGIPRAFPALMHLILHLVCASSPF